MSEDASSFAISLPSYEGPFELLLELIEKRKVFINDISLSQITDDYLAYLQDAQFISLADQTRFIGVAATLILIKSKSLLPGLTLTEDEQKDVSVLEDRVKLYELLSSKIKHIAELWKFHILPKRPYKKITTVRFTPDPLITPNLLLSLASQAEKNIPKTKEKLPAIELEKVMSITDMITNLEERITKAISFSFREFATSSTATTDRGKKVHVIVGFLAVLELVRKGILSVAQSDAFGDITVKKE